MGKWQTQKQKKVPLQPMFLRIPPTLKSDDGGRRTTRTGGSRGLLTPVYDRHVTSIGPSCRGMASPHSCLPEI